MNENINCAMLMAFAAVNDLDDDAARVALSMDITHTHSDIVLKSEKIKRGCICCRNEQLDALYDEFYEKLDRVHEDVAKAQKNERIGLQWWAFTSYDKNN